MCDEIDRRCNLDVIKERHLMKRSLGNSNKVDIGDEKFISCSLSPATAELVEHPQNEGSTLQSSSSTVRLVLHAVDGVVPYLTSALLRQCFPPAEVSDVLIIGVAVRDTCACPVYRKNSEEDKKKKSKKETARGSNSNRTSADTAHDSTTTKSKKKLLQKPLGYSYSSCIKPDAWLTTSDDDDGGYTRVVVPAFDLIEDAIRFSKNNAIVTISDKSVLMWTSNGRIPLTSKLYAQAVSHCRRRQQGQDNKNIMTKMTIVPLFAMLVPSRPLDPVERNEKEQPQLSLPDRSLKSRRKHKATALQRCEQWFNDLFFPSKATTQATDTDDAIIAPREAAAEVPGDETSSVWFPLVVDDDTNTSQEQQREDKASQNENEFMVNNEARSVESMLLHHRKSNKENYDNKDGDSGNSKKVAAGICLIGWQYIENAQKRQSILRWTRERLTRKQDNQDSPNGIFVLSVRSLKQFLELACMNIDDMAVGEGAAAAFNYNNILIGCNLPAKWAQQKKAFVLDFHKNKNENNSTCNGNDRNGGNEYYMNKRPRLDEDYDEKKCAVPSRACKTKDVPLDENGCVDLLSSCASTENPEHPWTRDARPLVATCTCMTCRLHSRAYLCHLVAAKEMLAEMLLFIHNLHHLLELLRKINTRLVAEPQQNYASQKEKDEFCAWLQGQLSKV